MANLTLVIDDDVLRRARVKAVQEGTSVNAVVRNHLETYADRGDDLREAGRRLVELSRRVSGSSGPNGRTWTRDELYER